MAMKKEVAAYIKANSHLSLTDLLHKAICEDKLSCVEIRNRAIKSEFIQLMKTGAMTFTDIYFKLADDHDISERHVDRIVAK